MAKKGRAYIATSGWHYGHWKGPFYPEGLPERAMLAYYSGRFDTVEINNSFYRLPEENTLIAWRRTVPEGFVFSVKASRLITHLKKLKDPDRTLPLFFERIRTLGDKLGPVLFQLPPRFNVNLERLVSFLGALPKGLRYAFEFRDTSWFDKAVFKALKERNAAVCIYDFNGVESARQVTADFVYVRLHGPVGKYGGSYSDRALIDWADEVSGWLKRRDVYFYFDNDQAGYAVRDALRLKAFVRGQGVG